MMPHRIIAAIERLDRLLVVVSAVLLLVSVMILMANVASRYLLYLSLPWSAELARYTMVWSALLAAAVLVHRRQHLGVDLLGSRLAGRPKRLVELFVSVGSMAFFLIVAVSGAILVQRTAGQVASSIEWLPMPAVYAIMPVSAVLMWLGEFANLLKTFCGEDRPA